MANKVTMPKVAMAMNEGTVSQWIKSEGDKVTKGEELFTLETEKTAYEVEAVVDGYLHIVVKKGETVPVETLVAYLAEDEAELAEFQAAPVEEEAVSAEEVVPVAPAAPAPVSTAPEAPGQPINTDRIKVSPLAKKMAADKAIDLSYVEGTGPSGRIKKRDIVAFEAKGGMASVMVSGSVGGINAPLTVKAEIPVKGMRKAIREGMMYAMSNQALCPGAFEIEMDNVMAARKAYVARAEEYGTKVSPQAFFLKALACAVKDVPIANARMDGDIITVYENVNIGIAIAVEDAHDLLDGLIVPVIKNCDAKGVVQIDKEFKELVKKAREGKLGPDDLSEGTITISSVAGIMPGYSMTTPILNSNQTYIGQPGNIVERVVVKNGEQRIAQIMTWSYTFDHRVMDGVPACKLHTRLKEYLENPALMAA